MADADHPIPQAAALPDELREMTYDQATPEQVHQVREHVRAQLAALDSRWTPEERQQRRTEFLRSLNAA